MYTSYTSCQFVPHVKITTMHTYHCLSLKYQLINR